MTDIVSIGLQLHHIILPIAFFGLLAIVAICFVVFFNTDSDFAGLAGFGFGMVAVFVGIGWFAAAFPFDSKYYPLYSVSGKIETISNGFVDGSGDSTFLSYVVTLEGDDRPYRIDDPRITTLDGKDVELLCTIGWVYQGADKWSCDIRDGGY